MDEELWRMRINDLNGWFMESFTEQPDLELQKLSNLIANDEAQAAGEMIIQWTKDYAGEDL